MKTFIHDGIGIKYHELGTGDTIIFLHGFGASSYCWRHVSAALSLKYRVILIDLKGFGLSDKPLDEKYSASDQADIIINFIRKNNIQNVTLAGHSFGGAVTLLTYLKLSEEGDNPIKSLILIDSAAYKQKIPSFIAMLRIPVINKLILSILPDNFVVKWILKESFYDDKKITDEMIKTYVSLKRLPGAQYALIKTAEQLTLPHLDEITEKYKEIKAPVLIIWGREDEITPLSIGQRLEKDIPNSKLVIIPQCGHIPQEEKPSEKIQISSDFLKMQYEET
jgi:pimeloyl-ACP methyl ester carboxylesterase